MNYTAKEIAKILKGTVEGNETVVINSISKIEEAKNGDLCFLSNSKYNSYLYSCKGSIVIVNNNLQLEKKIVPTLIRVKDPYIAFAQLLELHNKTSFQEPEISKNTHIANSSKIGKNCYIGPFVFIGDNVEIGDNVQIHPHCFIGDNVIIKNNTILFSGAKVLNNCKIGHQNYIHSGVIIGSDGFGFANNSKGNYKKIQQIGNVITHDFVEIGANTTIDRATLGSTIINKGVKLDNQIQIGHNVEIGKNTVIAGLVGIAGSTKIGENCMIGGSTGIAGHLKIGNNVRVAGHTGVGSNIKNGETIQGPYAFNQKDFLRSYVIFKKLPKMHETLEKIKKQLQQ
tara:strand:- start:1109 stop:2131 length:1023 start_codon:yes stop_codon:yes gene_type:complete